jgi:ribosomal-protein-alanine N-acetyltransferase
MFILRYMTVEDIPAVLEIDQLSFASPWSQRSYEFELYDNANAHMIVLVAPASDGMNGANGAGQIVGYGGMWMIDGEAHVSTLAVHPDWRGQRLGEVLLAGLLSRAMIDRAEYSVLEVRVSNAPAIALYRKYEYVVVGRRKGYYRDNSEDAFLMHLAPLDGAYHVRFADRVRQLSATVRHLNLLTQPDRHRPATRPRSDYDD